ncbi:MAG: hypothetical protein JST65_09455 [Acidobacteria bacterium]|nr:hypothetical protein [Acidobacteriota bacterium]
MATVPASLCGRKLSDCIEAAKRYEAGLEGLAVADAAYALDVFAAVEERRDVFDPPNWD